MFAVIIHHSDNGAFMIDRVVGGFTDDEACHKWAETNVAHFEQFSIVEVEHVDLYEATN